MKKKIKKVIIILIVLAILAGACVGGVFAYKKYRDENLTAKVEYVSNLNWGYYGDEGTTVEGYITNDYSQDIYIQDKKVKEILVKEGDSVDVGTPLLVYDTTQEELQVDMKQLDLQKIDNDILLANRELERLKKVTPVPDDYFETQGDGTGEEGSEAPLPQVFVMESQKQLGDAYNYIDGSSNPYAGSGTPQDPYRFLCTPECYVTGSYLNMLVQKEQAAAFEIWSGNNKDFGSLLSCWIVDGSDMASVAEDSRWQVSTQEMVQEESFVEEEAPIEDEAEEDENDTVETVYTVSELKDAITEKENDLKSLDIEKRKEELSLQKLKKEVEKGTVTSTVKGVVKSIGDAENPALDGSPFLQVMGSSGIYIQGNIGELMLDQVQVGQTVSVSSWNNGGIYDASITEIKDYPSENGWYGGDGNSNVSYYQFTAYIENPEGLTSGDYVNVSLTGETTEMQSDALCIEKAYVREENGRSYVLKAGEDNRLVKQYVQTGKTVYGSAIEIKGGLSDSDRIAFPYGKTAKEGIRAVESDEIE